MFSKANQSKTFKSNLDQKSKLETGKKSTCLARDHKSVNTQNAVSIFTVILCLKGSVSNSIYDLGACCSSPGQGFSWSSDTLYRVESLYLLTQFSNVVKNSV